jgi:flagellar biosynthesis chaperone FliJ
MKYTQARDLVEAALDALSEESEKEMSTRNIKTYQGHIDRLEGAIKHHSSRKPGWSDRYGNDTQSNINAKVKDLTNIHKELTTRHKKALENHASGNYGANRGHYLLNTDWH